MKKANYAKREVKKHESAFTTGTLKNTADTFIEIASVLVTYFVIKAIVSLAAKLQNEAMVAEGRRIMILIFTAFVCSTVASVFGDFILTGTVATILGVAGSVISLMQYIL